MRGGSNELFDLQKDKNRHDLSKKKEGGSKLEGYGIKKGNRERSSARCGKKQAQQRCAQLKMDQNHWNWRRMWMGESVGGNSSRTTVQTGA